MIICKTIEIDMGHRVCNHKSKCRNLHGHRYKIKVGVEGNVIMKKGCSDEGMVIDFGDLKEIMMKEIDDKYDHTFMMYCGDEFYEVFAEFKQNGQKINFVTFIPTVENITEYFFNCLKPIMEGKGIKLVYIKIWETPTSMAEYRL